jgi:hypothetical protein
MAKIFISYSRQNSKFADDLFEALKRLGHDPRMDREDIKGGDDWQKWIEQNIREVDYMVVLWSNDSA